VPRGTGTHCEDVSRAHFTGEAQRRVFVNSTEKDEQRAQRRSWHSFCAGLYRQAGSEQMHALGCQSVPRNLGWQVNFVKDEGLVVDWNSRCSDTFPVDSSRPGDIIAGVDGRANGTTLHWPSPSFRERKTGSWMGQHPGRFGIGRAILRACASDRHRPFWLYTTAGDSASPTP
jgi:hypothetical protein